MRGAGAAARGTLKIAAAAAANFKVPRSADGDMRNEMKQDSESKQYYFDTVSPAQTSWNIEIVCFLLAFSCIPVNAGRRGGMKREMELASTLILRRQPSSHSVEQCK